VFGDRFFMAYELPGGVYPWLAVICRLGSSLGELHAFLGVARGVLFGRNWFLRLYIIALIYEDLPFSRAEQLKFSLQRNILCYGCTYECLFFI
jgi:hypothetical protein